jgi:hypothetical protein
MEQLTQVYTLSNVLGDFGNNKCIFYVGHVSPISQRESFLHLVLHGLHELQG